MTDYTGTVGFITGGASGIGLGVARALGQRGMTVILADIEPGTLDEATSILRDEGIAAHAEVLDVADADAYAAVARRTLDSHGAVNFLFNNAGVAAPSPMVGGRLEDWRWTLDVNVMGVVHGVHCFLPAMLDSGKPGWVINTASLAGHSGNAGMGSYCASKFAVVGYSEVLRAELADTPIDVAVLCPAWVRTRIAEALRNHPDPSLAGRSDENLDTISRVIAEEGISVEALAERVLRGMDERTFYLFTHADFWPLVAERLGRIREDYGAVLPKAS